MEKHLIAKLLVVSTIAVMVFGLLSMSIAMSMGIGNCPVMRDIAGCPPISEGVAFSNHHIEGFQSMMMTTAAIASALFLAVFFFFRVLPVQTLLALQSSQKRWPLAHGPPSPITSMLFWLALHNKFGDIASLRVRRMIMA